MWTPPLARSIVKRHCVTRAMSPALIVTDDWSGYVGFRKRGFDHHATSGSPHSAMEFLPIIHLVFANLKTWINGVHHGVSAKHLQAYLNEVTFRFSRRFYPFNAHSARCSESPAGHSRRSSTGYAPRNGRTLHLVGVGDNRIGKEDSTRCHFFNPRLRGIGEYAQDFYHSTCTQH